jgi:hypothetical protein
VWTWTGYNLPSGVTLIPNGHTCGIDYSNASGSKLAPIKRIGCSVYLPNFGGDYKELNLSLVDDCPPGGCPTFAVENDTSRSLVDENPLLISSLNNPNNDVTDYYLIQSEMVGHAGELNFTIHEPETEHSWLDQVGLIEVEVNQDELVAVTDLGEIVNYTAPERPFNVILNDSADVTDILTSIDDNILNVNTGDKLEIEINDNGDGNDILVLDGGISPIVYKDILAVLKFWIGGDYRDVGSFYLRPNKSQISINMGELDEGTLEIEFLYNAVIDYVAIVRNLNTADVETLLMTDAEHSVDGNVTQQLTDIDQNYAEIFPEQQIDFTFREGSHTKPQIRYVLKTVGRYELDTAYVSSKMTKVSNNISIPNQNRLYDNFPNPFNPTTLIKYSIKDNGLVSLKVYNIMGEEVADLVNQVKNAGTYTVNFNGSDLASGVYIYELRANDYVSSKKMLLIK